MNKFLVKLTGINDFDKGSTYVDAKIILEKYNVHAKPKIKSIYDLIKKEWNISGRDNIEIADSKKKDYYYPINQNKLTSSLKLSSNKIFIKMSLVNKKCSLAYDNINDNFYIIRDDIPQQTQPTIISTKSDTTTYDIIDDISSNSDDSIEEETNEYITHINFNGKIIRVYRDKYQTQYHFNVYDISDLVRRQGFVYIHLNSNETNFNKGEDYICVNDKNTYVKYFTPHGALRCVCSSRNIDSTVRQQLRNWIVNIGYDQEIPIPDKISDIVFATILNDKISGLYLIDLGELEEIDSSIGINKKSHNCDKHIFKFGYSNDIKRRLSEHTNHYGKYGCRLKLKYIVSIDEIFLAQAETRLKHLLENKSYRIDCGTKYQELLIGDCTNEIKNCFLQVANEFKKTPINEDIIELKYKLSATDTAHESQIAFIKSMYDNQKLETSYEHTKQLNELKNKYELEIKKLETKINEQTLLYRTEYHY
jgi:hypothetical protein